MSHLHLALRFMAKAVAWLMTGKDVSGQLEMRPSASESRRVSLRRSWSWTSTRAWDICTYATSTRTLFKVWGTNGREKRVMMVETRPSTRQMSQRLTCFSCKWTHSGDIKGTTSCKHGLASTRLSLQRLSAVTSVTFRWMRRRPWHISSTWWKATKVAWTWNRTAANHWSEDFWRQQRKVLGGDSVSWTLSGAIDSKTILATVASRFFFGGGVVYCLPLDLVGWAASFGPCMGNLFLGREHCSILHWQEAVDSFTERVGVDRMVRGQVMLLFLELRKCYSSYCWKKGQIINLLDPRKLSDTIQGATWHHMELHQRPLYGFVTPTWEWLTFHAGSVRGSKCVAMWKPFREAGTCWVTL